MSYRKDNICRFYNPYFEDGCSKGKKCEFLHLKQAEYEKFVQSKSQIKCKSVMFYGFKSAVNKFHQHRYYLAAQIFKSLLNENGHIPQYNLWCARTMEKMSFFQSAELYYRKAISTQPTNATFHGRYATLLHMKLNRFFDAKKHYEIALNLRNDINALHCHYGKLLCDLGGIANYEKAQYHFKKCLEIYESDEECHFYFGQLLYKLGHMNNAEVHIKKALYLQNKPYVWHYYYYGLICIELLKFNEAKQYLQICLDLQYFFKSMRWGRIYFEYGLLLIFIFNSYKMGLKYISIAVNSFSNAKRSQKSQCQYQQIYEKLKKHKTITNTTNNIKQYNEYRQINKDKDFISDKNENENENQNENQNQNKNVNQNENDNVNAIDKQNENENLLPENACAKNQNVIENEKNNNNIISNNISPEKWSFYLNNNDNKINKDQLSDDTLSSFCIISIDSSDDISSENVFTDNAKYANYTNYATGNALNNDRKIIKQCSVENEFYRFLKCIRLQNYYNKFKDTSINDIRLIEHIDNKFLSETIGMSQKEIKIWINRINNLKSQRLNLLNKWKQIDRFLYALFYDIFAENGILTIKSFGYYFKKPEDILYLVNNNYDYAKSIWNLFQNAKPKISSNIL